MVIGFVIFSIPNVTYTFGKRSLILKYLIFTKSLPPLCRFKPTEIAPIQETAMELCDLGRHLVISIDVNLKETVKFFYITVRLSI